MDIALSFSTLCLLLVTGKALRVRFRLLQRLYLPAAVIGGLAGLGVIQVGGDVLPSGATAGWGRLPGFLINIVFAGLFLGVHIPSVKTIWNKAGPQLAYGQIVAWGQYVVGLGLCLAFLTPLLGVPGYLGAVLPVGFEGGHGTAAGLGPTFDVFNWPEGRDYALTSATVGIVFGIVVGMALINWAARRGYARKLQPVEELSDSSIIGIYDPAMRPSAGRQTVAAASIDSLALHIAIVGVAVFLGYLMKLGLVGLESLSPTLSDKKLLTGFPLFPLCMLGGLVIQLLLAQVFRINIIDRFLMQRIAGTAMDFLVVAAIAMINVSVVLRGVLPFTIIALGGILWNVFCVMWIARRLLPRDSWFERAIAEMGQSMGVTATGLLLLRVVDPEAETDATAAFGYKQLLHEPIMGGGLWTSLAVPLAITTGAWPVFLISCGALVAWFVLWTVLFRGPLRAAADATP